jgi:sugar lactone lactonase YvrE
VTSAAPTILAALAFALASCQSRNYAIVTVQAASGLPAIGQLQLVASDGLSDGGALLPAAPVAGGIVFPESCTVGFSPSAGTLSVVVEGLGLDGGIVARGGASTGLQSSIQATLTVTLTTACDGPRGCDPAGVCDGTVACGPAGACVPGSGPPPDGTPCGPLQGVCALGSCFLPYCGSGVAVPGEQCDWGSGVGGAACTGPDGGCNSDTLPNACRTDCEAAHCGDGVVDQGERCDLGQRIELGQPVNGTGQGCNATCTLIGAVSTYAGEAGGPGDFDGVGTDARFESPGAVAVDSQYVYVIDPGEPLIRRVSRAAGAVSTWIGRRGVNGYADGIGSAATLGRLGGLALAGGYLYVSDAAYAIIRRVDPATGAVTTVAGVPGALGFSDGPALQATFDDSWGLATCDGQELYIADLHNCTLRRLDLDAGVVTTVAGDPAAANHCSEVDGQGAAARFFFPTWLACDGPTLFVGDNTGTVRFIDIDAGYQVSSLQITQFGQYPPPVAVAGGMLYVIDASTGVLLAGPAEDAQDAGLFPFAGGGAAGNVSGFSDGVGTAALFNAPEQLAADPTGTLLYVPDTGNSAIRMVTLPDAGVTTLAGEGPHAGSSNGVGAAARFKSPWGIAWAAGSLYVADRGNDLLRAVSIVADAIDGGSSDGGAVTTLAGQAGLPETVDGTGPLAAFTVPTAVTPFEGGLVVSESATLRQVTLAGDVTTLAGQTHEALGFEDGTLAAAQFSNPSGLAAASGSEGAGELLYIADQGNDVVREVDLDAGLVSTLAGHPGLAGTGDAEGARFDSPGAVAALDGLIYVADTGNQIIRSVDPDGGLVTSVAGFPGVVAYTDGVGQAAAFNNPQGLCSDGVSLFVVDTGNNAIRQVDPATGAVSTVAGGGSAASLDGTGSGAYFNTPTGCAWDPASGDLFVTDRQENVLRRIH